MASIAQLDMLLMTDELCEQLSHGDGFHPCRHSRDNWIIIQIQSSENVGDELLILKLSARRCHVICQALHFSKVLANCRSTF